MYKYYATSSFSKQVDFAYYYCVFRRPRRVYFLYGEYETKCSYVLLEMLVQ